MKGLCAIALLVLVFCGTEFAARTSTTAPSHNYRLVQPWSKLKTLTQEQRRQIYEIHRRALDEIKKVQQHEHDEIVGLLSDQQKLELVEGEESATVDRKLKSAAARMPATVPATQPTP